MRMWMIPPKLLCRQHLLGEHNELHKHRPSFVKRHSIRGRLKPKVLVEPLAMASRHEELAAEMLRRGYNHRSPYEQPPLDHLSNEEQTATVDPKQSIADLTKRCLDCQSRIRAQEKNHET